MTDATDELYTAEGHGQAIRDWLNRDEPRTKPAGVAICGNCGGKFVEARVAEGLRFIFEPSDDGEWNVSSDGLAKPVVGGEFAIHNCRRTA